MEEEWSPRPNCKKRKPDYDEPIHTTDHQRINAWLMKQVDDLQAENKTLRAENLELREKDFEHRLLLAKKGYDS